MRKGSVVSCSLVALCAALAVPGLRAQPRDNSAEALAIPFKGITADGKLEPGLFKSEATGVSTGPIREAASEFLASLTPEQRQKTTFPADSPEWRTWDNRHFPKRAGVGFDEMNERQRRLAFALLRASLSAKGFQQSRDVMKLNETLAELTDKPGEYGEWLYWITLMGQPSEQEPWGWQLDGHHLIINYFILGDQVVMTPNFVGSEPVRAESGKHKGTVVLQEEQDRGLAFMRSLEPAQQEKARLRPEKGPTDTLTEFYKDNAGIDYAGLRAADLTAPQQRQLLELIGEYVGRMREGHARVKMSEVEQHLDRTWFGWIGGTEPGGVFYYRIHSPVILIEFDHQRPIALDRSNTPTRQHIHTIIRTPNGNDYGKDLLRQHYREHRHD